MVAKQWIIRQLVRLSEQHGEWFVRQSNKDRLVDSLFNEEGWFVPKYNKDGLFVKTATIEEL